jgi:hypothetical protein
MSLSLCPDHSGHGFCLPSFLENSPSSTPLPELTIILNPDPKHAATSTVALEYPVVLDPDPEASHHR